MRGTPLRQISATLIEQGFNQPRDSAVWTRQRSHQAEEVVVIERLAGQLQVLAGVRIPQADLQAIEAYRSITRVKWKPSQLHPGDFPPLVRESTFWFERNVATEEVVAWILRAIQMRFVKIVDFASLVEFILTELDALKGVNVGMGVALLAYCRQRLDLPDSPVPDTLRHRLQGSLPASWSADDYIAALQHFQFRDWV